MNRYASGRRAEYKTMKFYEKQNYECFRAAGSHGPFDVIAIGRHDIKLIQVKKGRDLSTSERTVLEEQVRMFKCPPVCQKLLVEWKFRQTLPLIKELR